MSAAGREAHLTSGVARSERGRGDARGAGRRPGAWAAVSERATSERVRPCWQRVRGLSRGGELDSARERASWAAGERVGRAGLLGRALAWVKRRPDWWGPCAGEREQRRAGERLRKGRARGRLASGRWTRGAGPASASRWATRQVGLQGAVCAEGACPREALAGHGGRTLQVGPRRARACACARAGASAGSGCGDGPACQAEWRSGRVGPREESGHAEPGRVREEGVDWPCGKRERESGLGWRRDLGWCWVDFGCGFVFYFSLSNSKSIKHI